MAPRTSSARASGRLASRSWVRSTSGSSAFSLAGNSESFPATQFLCSVGGGLCVPGPLRRLWRSPELLQALSANVAAHEQAKSEQEKNSKHHCAKSNKSRDAQKPYFKRPISSMMAWFSFMPAKKFSSGKFSFGECARQSGAGERKKKRIGAKHLLESGDDWNGTTLSHEGRPAPKNALERAQRGLSVDRIRVHIVGFAAVTGEDVQAHSLWDNARVNEPRPGAGFPQVFGWELIGKSAWQRLPAARQFLFLRLGILPPFH